MRQPPAPGRRRACCLAHNGAGDWLTALPNRALGLHLRGQEFVYRAKYRLGLPVYQTTGTCPARGCRQESDPLGDHALSCTIGGERIAWHNGLRDTIIQVAQQAGLDPQKEVENLLPLSADRPADVFLRNWTAGKCMCLTSLPPMPCRRPQ